MQPDGQERGTRRESGRALTAAIDIAASPPAVWAVVSDLGRTGEWSPECRRVQTLGRIQAGCWLIGFNRRGTARWTTLSRVVGYQPGQEISWQVLTNGSVWTYRLEATPVGTRLVETRQTPNGISPLAGWFTRRFLGGQNRHDDELEAGMRVGLAHIKAIVEAARDTALR
jgi:hypothetical protein